MNPSVLHPAAATTVAQAVDAYLAHLRRKKAAPATLKKYRPYLREFAEWAGERHPAAVKSFEIDALFLAHWEEQFEARNGREPSDQSRRAVIGCLSSFYNWLHRFGLLTDEESRLVPNPMLAIEPPKIFPKAELDYLRPDEWERLLATPMKPGEEILTWFLAFTGLRLAEALSLRVRDVDLVDGVVNVRASKTARGIRGVAISAERVRISKWLAHLNTLGLLSPDGPFFTTKNRTAMAPQQAERWVRRVGESAGIQNLTPHRLRRSFGSRLYQGGVPLDRVSLVLGHADTRTTELFYARLTDDQARRDMLAVLDATG